MDVECSWVRERGEGAGIDFIFSTRSKNINLARLAHREHRSACFANFKSRDSKRNIGLLSYQGCFLERRVYV